MTLEAPLRRVTGKSYPQQDFSLPFRLAAPSVSLVSGTPQALFTPSGKTALVTLVLIEITGITGTVTADAWADIGVTAGDLFKNEELTQVRAVGDIWAFTPKGKMKRVTTGNTINLTVNTLPVGVTVLGATAHVFGSLY